MKWTRLPVVTLTALALLGTGAAPTTAGATATADGRGGGCAGADLLFCEDFERLPTGGASSLRWGIDTRTAR